MHYCILTKLDGKKASTFCDWHWCHSSHSVLTASSSLSRRPHCHTQATDKQPKSKVRPHQQVEKDPLDPSNDFLAVGPSLWTLQLTVKGRSATKCTIVNCTQLTMHNLGDHWHRPAKHHLH